MLAHAVENLRGELEYISSVCSCVFPNTCRVEAPLRILQGSDPCLSLCVPTGVLVQAEEGPPDLRAQD
jgi:hypothetical protein